MKSFRKVLSVVLALLTVFSLFTTTVNAEVVTGKNKITSNYFRHAAFKSNGVLAQWVDVNGDGSITDEEVVYCLERGVPSTTEISTFW